MLQLAGEAGAAYAQRRQVYSTSVCAACPCYTYLSVHYHTEEGHKPLGSQSDNWFCCLDPTARRQSYLEWLGCLSDQSQPQSQHSLPRCPGCPTSSPLHEPLASQPACWHRGLHPLIRTATPKILPCQGSWRQAGSSAAHPGSVAACSAHLKQQHKINQCHSAHPIFPRMTWLQKRPDRQSREIWSLLKTGSLIALAQMEMMHKLARLPRHRNICVTTQKLFHSARYREENWARSLYRTPVISPWLQIQQDPQQLPEAQWQETKKHRKQRWKKWPGKHQQCDFSNKKPTLVYFSGRLFICILPQNTAVLSLTCPESQVCFWFWDTGSFKTYASLSVFPK